MESLCCASRAAASRRSAAGRSRRHRPAAEIDLRRRAPVPEGARGGGGTEGVYRLVHARLRVDPETLALLEPGPDRLQALRVGADEEEREEAGLAILGLDPVPVRQGNHQRLRA